MSNEDDPSGLDKPCSKLERYNRRIQNEQLWKLDTAELLEIYTYVRCIYNYYLDGQESITVEEAYDSYETANKIIDELEERGMEFHYQAKKDKK